MIALHMLWVSDGLFAADKTIDAKGFDRTRPTSSQFPFEHVDPMTGNLILSFTDLTLPGNAGFDLRIQRTYNSKIFRELTTQAEGESSWAGFGWTLHLARLINPHGHDGVFSGLPEVEMADGRRHALYPHLDGNGTTHFMTTEYWTFDRPSNGADPKLRLPNGVTYTFGGPEVDIPDGDGAANELARYVSRIEDAFGNRIDIAYYPDVTKGAISTITQTLVGGQQRTVSFTCNAPAYTTCDVANRKLRRMR